MPVAGRISRIEDGTVTNAKIADSAGIVSSKLATPGQVLQVVQTVKTDTFTSSAVTTFTDLTGLSVSITPSSTSSKVLINVTVAGTLFRPGVSGIMFRLLRDSTPIGIGDTAGNRNLTTLGDAIVSVDSVTNATISFLDSPSSTSATTYKIQFWQDGANRILINRTVTDSDIAGHQRCISQITATEIAG